MEAATPLPLASVRTRAGRLYVDGLVVEDECAVRLASEREQAGEDAVKLVLDAIEIGARVLDREQAGAHTEFVKAEFERAARDLDVQFVERARRVAERLDDKLEQAFGPESGHVTRALERHFSDASADAVQHKVRDVVRDVSAQMQHELRIQLLAEGEDNPLAKFHRVQLAVAKQTADAHSQQLRAVVDKLEATRLEVERLRAEGEKLEQVAAERERGTAKGRTFEEEVAAAIEQIAAAQGDDAAAVGDVKEATGKTGDVVVGIDGCAGPPRGRIVFEAKNSRLSRPEALRELDRARGERSADFAVLVVAGEAKVPARMLPLREYNGDKLVVTYDPDDGPPLELQVAYALARARVLMRRGGGEGIDAEAVRAGAERAIQALGEVQRIKQQLTASKTAVDKAAEIVDAMAAGVKASLAEIQALVAAGHDSE
jgi:hypothetical protein